MDVGRQGVHQEQQIDSRGSFLAQRALIIELAAQYRLPMCYAFRGYAELGGLMAYAPDLGELAKRMANDVHEIFNGAKPGEIPFYQPTKFELIINLKTAIALGLALPPNLLVQADEVIE
jgi:putative tryptophan/tyrosine transport system substrate-binding protein